MDAPHVFRLTVPASAIDANGHVNNVEYLRWMQNAAVDHAETSGCGQATREAGASWVVRSHHVEYVRPSYENDELLVVTWVSTILRASSLRKYRVLRQVDHLLLAKGETTWVFIDAATARPRTIPKTVSSTLPVVAPEDEGDMLAGLG